MAKKWPPRPEHDFWITSLQSQLAIEANHRQAGFPPVDHEVVRRRFWQWLSFLQRHNYLVRTIADSIEDLKPTTELRNSDFTDPGYVFEQRYGDRWIGRMHNDRGADAEEKFIEKWHQQLLAEQRLISDDPQLVAHRVSQRG